MLQMLVGLNINGDAPEDLLTDRAKVCDKLGIPIWIGETNSLNPFKTAESLAEYAESKMFLFCSPSRRSLQEIIGSLNELREKFDNEFSVVFVMGRSRSVKSFVEFVRDFKEKVGGVLVGCNGYRVFEAVHGVADGFAFNYGVKFSTNKFKACYAPALVFPSEMTNELLMSSAVISGMNIDFEFISKNRDRLEVPKDIAEKSEVLLRYAICGDLKEVVAKITDALRFYDHIILGNPFFRDSRSVRALKRIVEVLEGDKGLRAGKQVQHEV